VHSSAPPDVQRNRVFEYHHVVPFAAGGETSVANLELRCRAHNQHEARCFVGAAVPMLRETPPVYGQGTRSGTSRDTNWNFENGRERFCEIRKIGG
jgi:HNH endonuclease